MSAVAGRKPLHLGGLSDEELVALARGGHEPAFDVIVQRYRGPLVSYCRRWVDPHRAEEVVQHTFMKAFLCLRDDDRPLALRPWLYRVAHNAALNALEKKGSDWEELDENYDGVPQPPQVAEQRARFLRVVGGIEALPLRQREALVLNEFEGRCYADIASQLGTSESGVRGLLRRARRQLRETAAAVLLPFPALRELVRSDGGRALQADRAGELIGSAGAAGGVGAAGGLAKVAAGVLAAGTIAGGGTAIEQRSDSWRSPEAAVAEAAEPQRAPVTVMAPGGLERTVVVAAAGADEHPVAGVQLALSGADLIAAATGPLALEDTHGGTLGGFDGEPDGDGGQSEPEPVVPIAPALPVATEPADEPPAEEQPVEQPAADGEPKKDSSESTDASKKPEAPADDGQTAGGDSADPAATPAAPLQPQGN
jgi:RNA polymerase sigma factor (sigma-70 family)